MEILREDMSIVSLISHYPTTIPVMLEYGIHCIGCSHADFETLRDAAHCNGIVDFNGFMSALERSIELGEIREAAKIRTICYEDEQDEPNHYAAA